MPYLKLYNRQKKYLAIILLVVIIVLLLPMLFGPEVREVGKKTRYRLMSISIALELYREDFGEHPTTKDGLSVLTNIYIRGEAFKYDEWGEEIQYENTRAEKKLSYSLYSKGKNSIDEKGSGDDIDYWSDDIQALLNKK